LVVGIIGGAPPPRLDLPPRAAYRKARADGGEGPMQQLAGKVAVVTGGIPASAPPLRRASRRRARL
jgi:hypothetical protein